MEFRIMGLSLTGCMLYIQTVTPMKLGIRTNDDEEKPIIQKSGNTGPHG